MFDQCCAKSNYQMSPTQNVVLRVTIVLGMIVAVVGVLYLTPLPEPYFKSCDRPCHSLEWPMICRAKIYLSENISEITINGKKTGPAIQICQNDLLLVDIVNQLPGHSLTVHWRGQSNREDPYMNGASLITQCPILGYNVFQYKFKATEPGTHLYHAYSDRDISKGIFGALVVRQANNVEPHKKMYDEDLQHHVVLISEFDNKLSINGKQSDEVFDVAKNKRYRFRVAFAGSQYNCPVTITIADHLVKIIALDGKPTRSLEINKILLHKGERVDFVLKTNQKIGNYSINVKSCQNEVSAIIVYAGKMTENSEIEKEAKEGRSFTTELCESKPGKVCGNHAKALFAIPKNLRGDVAATLFLTFGSKTINLDDKSSIKIYSTNNLTFTYPPSPLLTQLSQIPLALFCYGQDRVPKNCEGKEFCSCVHVEYIPLGATTELVLINQEENEHISHLYGYSFYVVGHRQFEKIPTAEDATHLKRNFNNPIAKDTIRIGGKSIVAVRFQADNPGFWMLRDENSGGWTRGLDVVLQVGGAGDMPAVPDDFPTCGNYIGPDFFFG